MFQYENKNILQEHNEKVIIMKILQGITKHPGRVFCKKLQQSIFQYSPKFAMILTFEPKRKGMLVEPLFRVQTFALYTDTVFKDILWHINLL